MICRVDDHRLHKRLTCDYPFIVFRARDPADAFERALELGRQQESTYRNEKGQKVCWTFARVEEINHLGPTVEDGEVGSLMDVFRSKKPLTFRHRFYPAKHRPLYDAPAENSRAGKRC